MLRLEGRVRFRIGVRARIAFLFLFQMIGFYGLLAGNKARTEVFTINHHELTVAHLCNQFNFAFAALISMPHFKGINFYQTRPKIKLLLLKTYEIFGCWELCPRPPTASCSWGFCPHNPKQSPPIADFWL